MMRTYRRPSLASFLGFISDRCETAFLDRGLRRGGANRKRYQSPLGLLAAFLLLALLAPASVPAQEDQEIISAFPFFYMREQDDEQRKTTNYLFGPFVAAEQTPDREYIGFRPLWSWMADDERGFKNLDILWPIGNLQYDQDPETTGTVNQARVLPFYFSKKTLGPKDGVDVWRILFPFLYQGYRNRPDEDERSYLVVFPFWWQFQKHPLVFPLYFSEPEDSFAFWPFYGKFHNLLGIDKVWFYGWPFWVRAQKDDVESYNVLWPFFNYSKGPDAEGARFWPLFGCRWNRNQPPRVFWLWPFGQYASLTEGAFKGTKLNMFFPFWIMIEHPKREIRYYFPVYGHSKSPNRVSRAYFWPVYSHTVSTKPIYEKHSIFWVLWSQKFGPKIGDWRAFLFAGHHKEPDKESAFVLWPIGQYFFDRNEAGNYDFERLYILPFYYSQDKRWDDGEVKKSRWLWPFFEWEREGSRRELEMLKLFPSEEGDGIDRNWAPLWNLYSSVRDPEEGILKRNILGPCFRQIRNKERDYSEFNLLFFQYRRNGEKKQISFLFGQLPWTISEGESGK